MEARLHKVFSCLLQVGSLVYARLLVGNKDMEPQLTCVDAYERASGMGELAGGYMTQCSVGLCRKYAPPPCT
jgi:exosome complex component RRP40